MTAILIMMLVCVSAAGAVETPVREIVLDACDWKSDEDARKVWRPIQGDTPLIETARSDGRQVLALPCNFSTNTHWRVGWDRDGAWDLSEAWEIRLLVTEPSGEGAQMLMYFRSGDGWYGHGFSAPGGTSTVRITPKQFGVEEKPAGWNKIDGIRLCVRRNEGADGNVLVSKMWANTRTSFVSVWRNDAGIEREGGVPDCVRLVADSLDRLGLCYGIVDDAAVAAGGLKGRRVAILPLNPVMPPNCIEPIRAFVAGGGKLVVCYSLPNPLGELLGLRTGDVLHREDGAKLSGILFKTGDGREVRADQHSWIARMLKPQAGTEIAGYWTDEFGKAGTNAAITRHANGYFVGHVLTRADPMAKDQLLLEMLGGVFPGAWEDVYARQLENLGHVAGSLGVEDLKTAIPNNRRSDSRRATEAIELVLRADTIADRAGESMREGKMAEAVGLMNEAHDAYVKAYAVSVPARVPEIRAVWCHSATGVSGLSWEQAMARLADCGFNTIFPNMLWGSGAAYRSDVLPMIAEAKEKGDQLAECMTAAKKHGIDVHVWKVNWRLWGDTPEAFKKMLLDEGRLQRDEKGGVIDWLCPSDPRNLQLELDAMLEVARKYDVAGLHFDYIRYPGMSGCYCEGCGRRFESSIGAEIGDWPTSVKSGDMKAKFLQFRRDSITALVESVSREARKLKPGIKISAAVFWHWPSARDDVAQDWKMWIEKGYLDFVCPMQYTESAEAFAHQLKSTMGWAGGHVPVLPGIGATLGLMPDGTLEQVLIARKLKAAGFVLFNYQPLLAEEHLPLLKMGATARD